ncbi:MAG: lysophospholipid acyltransferase family protein [Pseudomonadota bacterium]
MTIDAADRFGFHPVGALTARVVDGARAVFVLTAFAVLTLPLMPVQAILKRTSTSAARRFPNWYHRQVCRLLGVRLNITGAIAQDQPVLVVANHTSWLDIVVLSAVAPVSFVAKREVAGWPFVGSLARLQRTVFVDRTRRMQVGATASEIAERLQTNDAIVLFAEGTSSDGNRVLPFRSSLFAAVAGLRPDRGSSDGGGPQASAAPISVQTLSLVYTRLHGIPLMRGDRPLVGWYGDMEMGAHAWQLLTAGPVDAAIDIGPPIALDTFNNRKDIAQSTEADVRAAVISRLRKASDDAMPHS